MLMPVPWVNPAGPYSISQVVSVPPAVQDTSADISVMFVAIPAVGASQVAAAITFKV